MLNNRCFLFMIQLRETCCGDADCLTFSAFNGAFDSSGLFGCTRTKLALDPATSSTTVNADFDGWTKLSGPGMGNGDDGGDDGTNEGGKKVAVSVSFAEVADFIGVPCFSSAVSEECNKLRKKEQ